MDSVRKRAPRRARSLSLASACLIVRSRPSDGKMASCKRSSSPPPRTARSRKRSSIASGEKAASPSATLCRWRSTSPGLGYYCTDRETIGRRGDYLTSPEVSPMFGAMVGRQLREMWEAYRHSFPFRYRRGRRRERDTLPRCSRTGRSEARASSSRRPNTRSSSRYHRTRSETTARIEAEGLDSKRPMAG